VGDAGISVWIVIGWLQAAGSDKAEVLRQYGHIIAAEDLDAAVWFYEQNKQHIDQRLAEHAGAA
jgi:uncharacterized protein (DUF433 family)